MQDAIRVLHVLGALNRGGAETMIMNLYRNIDRSKIQFDFVVHTSEKCDYDEEINELGGEIHRLPRYNGKNHMTYKKLWQNLFSRHPEYQIVHGHMRSTAAIYLNIAKKYNIKTIAHSHSTSSGNGFPAVIKNIMQFPIRFIADDFFACSNEAGRWLFGKKIIRNKKYKIIKNAIDIDSFMFSNDLRIKMGKRLVLDDKFVIGHIGRFDHSKNHEFLINVFFEVQKSRKDAILLLIGEGELRNKLEQRIKELGIQKKVVFTGSVANVNEYMQIMDVFVFPSRFEGLGLVVIEAQAAGLPCVVSDVIPSEAFITELIRPLSLSLGVHSWAAHILNSDTNSNRESANLLIRQAGYNITEASEEIQCFYLSLLAEK